VSVSLVSRSGRARSGVPIVVAVVAFAVLAALGVRFIPDAAAAEAIRLEEGGFVFERSVDNILGVTNLKTGIRLEHNLDTATKTPTEAEYNALLTQVRTQIATDFGWDLTVEADRIAFRNELHLISQALFSIPDETFEVEEFASLRQLRDVAEAAEGTAECRDRCLPEVMDSVLSISMGAAVSQLLSSVTGAGLAGHIAICGVGMLTIALTGVIIEVGPGITGLARNDIRGLVMTGLYDILAQIVQFQLDADQVAAQGAETVAAATRAAAKEVETATPTEGDNESASDYDLVKDEL